LKWYYNLHIITTSFENIEEYFMLIGYARVSTQDQNLELQREALRNANCAQFFEDTISGSKMARPGLNQALERLREGDTLVVWKLDRLGRSVNS
jgi:DNA invertase Pin-like site-specific DNA recombinase